MAAKYRKHRGGVAAARGVTCSAGFAGVRNGRKERLDVALVQFVPGSVAAAVFTTNKVQAAPVLVSKEHLREKEIRGVVLNSGNANACTGPQGLSDAIAICAASAKEIGCRTEQVLVCSTGRIGRQLPVQRIVETIREIAHQADASQSLAAAKAIMTSDTVPKECGIQLALGGRTVRIGGMAKGAGMIDPNMATMLALVTTDARISRRKFQSLLRKAVEATFNRITVDGDMSTNDTVIAVATGAAGGEQLDRDPASLGAFSAALEFVCLDLAKQIVRDGESVTRFIELEVRGARSKKDARRAAEAVANSILTKCAWAGGDPNWGRILDALGYSGAALDPDRVDLFYDNVRLTKDGVGEDAAVRRARRIAAKTAFKVTADLKLGEGSWTVYTTDLTEGYVNYNLSE